MVNPSICRQTRHYPFTDAFKVMHRSRHLRAAAGHSTRHHDVLIISLISSRFLSGLIYRSVGQNEAQARDRDSGQREEWLSLLPVDVSGIGNGLADQSLITDQSLTRRSSSPSHIDISESQTRRESADSSRPRWDDNGANMAAFSSRRGNEVATTWDVSQKLRKVAFLEQHDALSTGQAAVNECFQVGLTVNETDISRRVIAVFPQLDGSVVERNRVSPGLARRNLPSINRCVNKTEARSLRYITRCLSASCLRQIACSVGHCHYIVNAIRDSHSNEQCQQYYNGASLKRSGSARRADKAVSVSVFVTKLMHPRGEFLSNSEGHNSTVLHCAI
ncbi:hypothetical protein LSAT2_016472 [Lamellibrachia satsuma]|nr:hypothetical protein LSAT2_016472 [Lamellibrachia satsuma]